MLILKDLDSCIEVVEGAEKSIEVVEGVNYLANNNVLQLSEDNKIYVGIGDSFVLSVDTIGIPLHKQPREFLVLLIVPMEHGFLINIHEGEEICIKANDTQLKLYKTEQGWLSTEVEYTEDIKWLSQEDIKQRVLNTLMLKYQQDMVTAERLYTAGGQLYFEVIIDYYMYCYTENVRKNKIYKSTPMFQWNIKCYLTQGVLEEVDYRLQKNNIPEDYTDDYDYIEEDTYKEDYEEDEEEEDEEDDEEDISSYTSLEDEGKETTEF